MAKSKNSVIPGVILILVGSWFLSRRFFEMEPFWEKSYPILMILISCLLIWRFIQKHHSGTLFWSIVLMVLGAFFLLRNYDVITYFYVDEYWPIFLIALGLGFVSLFIYQPHDWGGLIPGSICLFFGLVFSFHNFQGFFWGYDNVIANYWPAILIFIGSGIIISGLLRPSGNNKGYFFLDLNRFF